jgi:acetyl esterase/lipase
MWLKGRGIPVHIWRTANVRPNAPLAVYLHGGGFCYGCVEERDPMLRYLSEQAGCFVAYPEYRLAPENPYPAAVDDCAECIGWLADHAGEYGYDPTKLAVLGDSAGGSLTYAMVQRLAHTNPVMVAISMYALVDAWPQTRNSDFSYDVYEHLPEQDKNVGRAFVLGLLGHYALDSRAHPFVFAQQDEIIANAEGLDDASHEVHAVIERELDTWMLWTMRHLTVTDAPARDYLARTERVDRVAGALFSAVARQVFQIAISPEEFGAAVGNYQTLYCLIDPLESAKVARIASAERIVRAHSMAQAMSHTSRPSDECASANLGRRAWSDPETGAVSHDSFADLFFGATDYWAELTEGFVTAASDDFFEASFALDYRGRRVEA